MENRRARIFKTNILVAALLCIALVFGLVLGQMTAVVFPAHADGAQQTQAQTWDKNGWSEYKADSVSVGEGGIVMQDAAAAGYSFSNTTKNSYTLKELTVSMRVKTPKYDAGKAAATLYIGILPEDRDFLAENGSDYGVAFLPTSATEYAVWFVQRNKEATAIPGFDNLALVNPVSVSNTGVLSVLFHRETDNRWMIMINGNYQIDLNGMTEINNALDAMTTAHVAVAAEDGFPEADTQTAQLEVFQVGSDVLGKLNENGAIHQWDALNMSNEMTGEGVVFSAAPGNTDSGTGLDIKGGVQENLSAALDGLVISFKVDIQNCATYSLDVGIGTFHGAGSGADRGRYTFWDSFGDPPTVTGSVGIRFSQDGNATFLLLTRSATAGFEEAGRAAIHGGNVKVSQNAEHEYTMQFLKVGENWCVLINGRIMGSADAAFQANLNNALNSLAQSTGEVVAPWISYGDVTGKTTGYSAAVTIKGYGTRRWGKDVDPNEGVIGDEITGELEFSKKQWSSTCPEATEVDVKIGEEGFVLKGRNLVTGFDIGMNYKTMIDDLGDYAATFKLPAKVIPSSGGTHGYYGMYLGDATLKNFVEMKSIYVRWSYTTENAADGAMVEVIVWDNTDPSLVVAACSKAVSAKTAEGKETEMTVRFVLDADNNYRIYANGERVTTPAVETALTAQLAQMEAKYFYCNASYEIDGVGSGWSEDIEGVQEMTLVSLGGNKIVNKVPEKITGITLNTEALSSSSVKLTWDKAEYPVGEMDSHNFVPVGYVIERIKGDAEAPEATLTVDGDVDTLTYTDSDLDAETYYYYTVYAVDKDGNRLIVSGNKRVKTLAEENPGDNNGGDNNGGDNNGGDSNGGDNNGDNNNTSKGCGSFAGVSALGASVVLLGGVAVACFRKKK